MSLASSLPKQALVHGLPWGEVALLGAGLLIGVVVALALRRFWRRWRLLRRFQKGHAGEQAAEKLLVRLGYEMVAVQKKMMMTIIINGRQVEYEVRPDALVRKEGSLYLVEVKTGGTATDPLYSHTRRQLFEYYHGLPVDGVLLVNPEKKRVDDIRFATERAPAVIYGAPTRWWIVGWVVAFLVLLGAIGYIWSKEAPLFRAYWALQEAA